ncbi:MAG: 16S rRNA (guanine(527)-N(7))-methyltransferase RsmG [Treponema sp.]|nr:16S rRNA (guanine(527)-N(7))-methyltransferase RsmG [Treponema sp.]
MAVSQKLIDGLLELGFNQEQTENLSKKMDTYIGEIILFNSAYNLTNTSDYDEIVVNHILDSLSAYKEIKALAEELSKTADASSFRIADIGSGGGLPGIPLAAALPEYNFTLVERMDKRCAFLENCAAILGLKNVTVLKKEAEKVPADSFDIATFRAFRPLDKEMTKTLQNLIKPEGRLAAYKAKESSIKQEMDAIKDLVKEFKTITLAVPFLGDHERNLVIFGKN